MLIVIIVAQCRYPKSELSPEREVGKVHIYELILERMNDNSWASDYYEDCSLTEGKTGNNKIL